MVSTYHSFALHTSTPMTTSSKNHPMMMTVTTLMMTVITTTSLGIPQSTLMTNTVPTGLTTHLNQYIMLHPTYTANPPNIPPTASPTMFHLLVALVSPYLHEILYLTGNLVQKYSLIVF